MSRRARIACLVVVAVITIFGSLLGWPRGPVEAARIWNAMWMAAALAGVVFCPSREPRSPLRSLALVSLLASTNMALAWLRDPSLSHWPPSLALLTWTLATGEWVSRRDARLSLPVVFGALAALTNPVLSPAVVAVLTMIGRQRHEADPTRRAWTTSAALSALALAPLLVAWSCGVPAIRSFAGPSSHAAARSAYAAMTSLRESVVASGTDESLDALSTLAWVGCVGFLLALAVRVRRSARRAAPLLAAAAFQAAFITWWNVREVRFWWVVLWLIVLAALTMGEPRTWRTSAASLPLAGLLLVSNTLSGVLPSARAAPAGFLGRAKERLRGNDLLVLPHWSDAALTYFAGIPTTGWLTLRAECDEEGGQATPFDSFVRIQRSTAAGGGHTWVAVDFDGRPLVDAALLDLPGGVSRRELGRLVWGLTLSLEPIRVRQVVGVLEHDPCAPAARPSPTGAALLARDPDPDVGSLPGNAIDGRTSTQWVTTRPLGSIDVYFSSPRPIKAVDLVSSADAGGHPSTRLAQLTLWDGDLLVTERRVGFDRARPEQLSVPLNAERATCLGVAVVERAPGGGGFAEIAVH